MSVLLDALKKAAEEKKTLEDNKGSESGSSGFKLDEKADSLEDQGSNESLDSSNELVDKNTLETAECDDSVTSKEHFDEMGTADTGFTFKLSDEGQSNNTKNDALFDEEVLPEFDIDTLDDKQNTTAEDIKLGTAQNIEKKSTLEIQESESLAAELSLNTDDVDYLAKSDVTDIDSLISTLDVGSNTELDVGLANSENSKNEGLAIQTNDSRSQDELIDLASSSNTKQQKQSGEFDKQSFDWSLDDLPGYSVEQSSISNGLQNTNTHNAILMSGAHSPPVKSKSKFKSSSKVIVTLMVFLAFVLIGFYGIVYYQEQNAKLDQSMMKYNISSLNIKPNNQAKVDSNLQIAEAPTRSNLSNENIEVIPQQQSDTDTALEPNASENVENTLPTDIDENASINLVNEDTLNTSPSDNQVMVSESGKNEVVSDNAKTSQLAETKQYNPKKVSNNRVKAKPSSSKKPIVVKINKTKSLLAEGYEAYNAGNFVKAKQLFNNALLSDSNNTQALMGLGAIAVINGEYSQAMNFYEKVLQIKPNNLMALESIANMAGSVQLNSAWEKQLLNAIELYPQSAVLQNALGNRYARLNDWLKAQQAYFNAVVNNTQSADYMLNLAVSYDHLGQYKFASEYYTKALAYANPSKVRFDSTEVKARLISIKQLMLKGS